MTDKLKPCPFCGGENISSAEVMGQEPYNGPMFQQTACLDCNACGPKKALSPLGGPYECDKAWDNRTKEGE